MDSNTHSTGSPELPELAEGSEERPELAGCSGRLVGLSVVLDELEAEDLDQLSDSALTEDTLALQRLADRLGGQWLRRLGAVDARGVAGADQGIPAPSTASWLRRRLRLGAGAAREAVRTARALFGGPLPGTAEALVCGQLS